MYISTVHFISYDNHSIGISFVRRCVWSCTTQQSAFTSSSFLSAPPSSQCSLLRVISRRFASFPRECTVPSIFIKLCLNSYCSSWRSRCSIRSSSSRPNLTASECRFTEMATPTHTSLESAVALMIRGFYSDCNIFLYYIRVITIRSGFEVSHVYGRTPAAGTLTPALHQLFKAHVQSCILDGEMLLYDRDSDSYSARVISILLTY